jgi:hypothetical protein
MANAVLEEPVEEAVLRSLRNGLQEPMRLFEELRSEGYTTKQVKTTLVQLLHDGKVEFTTDQRLLSRGT